jgi:hypothetical protein
MWKRATYRSENQTAVLAGINETADVTASSRWKIMPMQYTKVIPSV